MPWLTSSTVKFDLMSSSVRFDMSPSVRFDSLSSIGRINLGLLH